MSPEQETEQPAPVELDLPDLPDETSVTIDTAIGRIAFVKIWPDHTEAPHKDADGMWKPYSFSTGHSNYKHPRDIGFEQTGALLTPNIGLRRKLKVGLAFYLSYFEHGSCRWMLKNGPIPPGVEFQWDGVRLAGLLVWEEPPENMGAKTYEDRMKDAQQFLDVYNAWCNGETYGYTVEVYKLRYSPVQGKYYDRLSDYRHDEPLYADTLGTYYGWDDLKSGIAESLKTAARVLAGGSP